MLFTMRTKGERPVGTSNICCEDRSHAADVGEIKSKKNIK